MFKALRKFFGKPNLSAIISSITIQVDKLEKLVDANNVEVDSNYDKIKQLEISTDVLKTESAKAGRISSRLKELVS